MSSYVMVFFSLSFRSHRVNTVVIVFKIVVRLLHVVRYCDRDRYRGFFFVQTHGPKWQNLTIGNVKCSERVTSATLRCPCLDRGTLYKGIAKFGGMRENFATHLATWCWLLYIGIPYRCGRT